MTLDGIFTLHVLLRFLSMTFLPPEDLKLMWATRAEENANVWFLKRVNLLVLLFLSFGGNCSSYRRFIRMTEKH